MKALYNTCWLEPWAKIAATLHENKSIEPVYWIGYYHDNSELEIPQLFSNIIYQSRWDAWKGKFSDIVEMNYTSYNLDFEYLKEYAYCELLAINAMDRMDPDRHSFSFQERQSFFRNMLRKCFALVDIFKIDIVIADRIPHRSYDYALYLVCKKLNIKYLFLYQTHFPYRSFIQSKIDNLEEYFYKQYYDEIRQVEGKEIIDIRKEISDDIIKTYDKCLKPYNEAVPQYMKEHLRRHKQNSNVFKLGFNFLLEFLNLKSKKEIHLRRNKGFWNDFVDVHPYAKKPNKSIEVSKYNAFEYGFISFKAINYKRNLKKYYERLASNPDLSKPYVFFAMHYQPEATSNPAAGIFVDHYLAIEQIASVLPEGWKVYVKEHKSQFDIVSEGQKARFKHLYDNLKKIKNVELLSLDTDTFEIIDKSKAVATLTGTVGWQALVRAKPVIVFGLVWYSYCKGVLKINSKKDIDNIIDFINNFAYDEKVVLAYLKVGEKFAPLAYSYLGRGKDVVNEKDCINNLLFLIEKGLNL